MGFNETLLRTEHPPHLRAYNKNRLPLSRIFGKAALFIVIFIISFHFPNFVPGSDQKGRTIKEILEILERQPTGLADVTKEELAEVIYEEATRYNQDPKFILALIAIESEFYNWSVSEKGAKGLMQIMPYVAQSLSQQLGIEWSGDRTLFNPYLNIRMGIYYFSQLALDFKDVGVALTAYNYGPTYVKGLLERNERIPNDYYRKFLTAYRKI
jgi:soluble lytic murein transglycosylase-like protein